MTTTRSTTRRLGAAAIVLLLPLAACSSSGGSDDAKTDSSGSGGGATTSSITIKGFKFDPTPATVKAGEKITIKNEDSSKHTFTSTDGPGEFDSGDIAQGDETTVTIKEKGTYSYECSIHDRMKGEITVE